MGDYFVSFGYVPVLPPPLPLSLDAVRLHHELRVRRSRSDARVSTVAALAWCVFTAWLRLIGMPLEFLVVFLGIAVGLGLATVVVRRHARKIKVAAITAEISGWAYDQ